MQREGLRGPDGKSVIVALASFKIELQETTHECISAVGDSVVMGYPLLSGTEMATFFLPAFPVQRNFCV